MSRQEQGIFEQNYNGLKSTYWENNVLKQLYITNFKFLENMLDSC